MRTILIVALVALVAEAQIRPGPRRNPPQRRQFLDPFQGPPRGGPPFRGPPPPPPPGFRGPPPPPPPPPPPSFRPQGGSPPRARPDQVLSLGQLPLNPRPEFDNPSFFPPQEENFAGEEVQFDGADFNGPIFADDVEGLRPNREEFDESFEPTPFVEGNHEAPPTTSVSQGPPQIETAAPETHAPRQQLEEPQQFEQETQEVVEFLSSPPPRRPQPSSIRTRSPRPQSRFPTHPNQLPLRNVIEEEAPLENRQRPVRDPLVEYEYDDEEDDEEEEPDRLSILLQNSHFSCISKKNGYYADEEVDCEVFHYCQENVKHSWLCPEGASFHQVHLICMPRSEDNICAKSSKFHFVNDFLYKEVDGENKTYADRYYPEGFEDGVAKLEDGGGAPVNNHPPPPPPPRNNIPTHFEPIEDSQPFPSPPRHPETFVDRLPQRQPEFLPPQFHSGENLPGRPFVDRRPGQFARPRPRPNGPQLGFQG